MRHLALGAVLNLVTFSAMGFGPAFWALGGPRRLRLALALAAPVGFGLVAVAGSLLVLMDRPVALWSEPLLAAGLAASLALSARELRHTDERLESISPAAAAAVGAVFAVTFTVALLPQLLGGYDFSILRGNGTDSFNYVAVAGYFDQRPMSWVNDVDLAGQIGQHPSLPKVAALLRTRWATMMMLAFSSRLAALEPYQYEYLFSVLSLLVAFGPASAWARYGIGLSRATSLAVAVVITTGFWAQFVIDERADSHQNAVPIAMALGCLLLQEDAREGASPSWRLYVLIGLVGAALVVSYPEFLAFSGLGVATFLAVRISRDPGRLRSLRSWAVTAVVLLAALWPLRQMLVSFIAMQFRYASAGANTWDQAYFPWLYRWPPAGLWGFGPLIAEASPLPDVVRWGVWGVGAVLTATLGVGLVRSLRRQSPSGVTLASTLTAAAFLQTAYLLLHGQRWAAGKSVSFGFPFMILALAGTVWGAQRPVATVRVRAWAARAAAVAAGIFVIVQIALAVARPVLASRRSDWPGYIMAHGDYRQHAFDIEAIDRAIESQPGLSVWTYARDPWVGEFIALAIEWEAHMVELGPSLSGPRVIDPSQLTRVPDYLIVDRTPEAVQAAAEPGAQAVMSGDLIMLRPTPAPLLVGLDNPNGIEGTPTDPFFWMGGAPTRLSVLSARAGCSRVEAQVEPGPSLPESPVRHLAVSDSVEGLRAPLAIGAGRQSITVHLRPGLNVIQLHVEDAPTKTLSTDPRPLLLHVIRLRLVPGACQGVGL